MTRKDLVKIMLRKFILCATGLTICSLTMLGCGKKAEEKLPEEQPVALSEVTEEVFQVPAVMPAVPSEETVLVTVNGKDITQADISAEIKKAFGANVDKMPPAQLAQFQAQMGPRLLDALVMKELLTAQVKSAGIEATDEDVDKAIGQLKSMLPPDTTVADQLAKLGMTETELRGKIKEDLAIQKLLQGQVGAVAEPSDEDVQAFYTENEARFEQPERVKARHILLAVKPDDPDALKAEKRAKIDDLKQQLDEGASFEELAREYSDCPSRAQGGSLGEFTRGRMVPEFEEAAFSQDVGKVGDVVETDFGYHLILVDDHIAGGKVALDEARDQIVKMIKGQQEQGAVEAYIKDIKDKADIKYGEGVMPMAPPPGAMP